jgi:hypothetical protein
MITWCIVIPESGVQSERQLLALTSPFCILKMLEFILSLSSMVFKIIKFPEKRLKRNVSGKNKVQLEAFWTQKVHLLSCAIYSENMIPNKINSSCLVWEVMSWKVATKVLIILILNLDCMLTVVHSVNVSHRVGI